MKIKILKEEYKSVQKKPGFKLSKTSLDAQVRAYIQKINEESVSLIEGNFKTKEMYEFSKFLFEQEEKSSDLDSLLSDLESEKKSTKPGDVAASVEKTEPQADDSDQTPESDLPDVNPKLDIDNFGTQVVALIENAKNKLDFENPIINIALQYIKDNYSQEQTNQLIKYFENMGYEFVIIGDDK